MKGVVLAPYLGLTETVVYQVRLPHTAWRDQCHIVAVGSEFDQLAGFVHTVTKVLRTHKPLVTNGLSIRLMTLESAQR